MTCGATRAIPLRGFRACFICATTAIRLIFPCGRWPPTEISPAVESPIESRNPSLIAVGVVAALEVEARALGPSMPKGGDPPLSELAAFSDGALLAVSGIGRDAAERAARALVDAGVASLMTFGMAGGLDPALAAGSVVLPCELIAADGARFLASRSWRERVAAAVSPLRAVSAGNLLTSARSIDTPADKSA